MKKEKIFNLVVLLSALGWTILVLFLCLYDVSKEKEVTLKMARKEAVITLNKDQSFRFWATRHGGVYVPVTAQTRPNPYLVHVAERDIRTPSGRELTLMNPAHMVRQMMQEYEQSFGAKSHITSLKVLNPENKPDAWERKALGLLAEGDRQEVMEVDAGTKEPFLRLMRPLVTQAGCLKCHAIQGYTIGDVRGAVSVSVALAPYFKMENRIVSTLIVSYASIWLVGLLALSFFTYWGRKQQREQDAYQEQLFNSHQGLQTIIDSVDSLIYVADMENHDLVMVNKYGRKLFGETKGKKCWEYFQSGQTGPCPFCTNDRLIGQESKPLGTYAWESKNTVSGQWFDCRDKAMQWIDGRLVRIQIATDITEKRQLAEEKEKLITTLQKVIDEIKTLRGIIPICSYCKNIRDDKGAWKQLETYIRDHSEAEFSHGICPKCYEKLKNGL